MVFVWFAGLIVACMLRAVAQPPITVGVQSILGAQWLPTFGDYLRNATPYNFQPILYQDDTVMLQDAVAGKLNFTFAGPVQYLCLALAGSTSDGVAELISISYTDGGSLEKVAGSIVVRANSSINTIQDLMGKIILTGPISSLAAFAAQWQVIQAKGQMDLFRDAAGVFLQRNISQLMPDLLTGIGDAAFVPSSYVQRDYPNTSYFKTVNGMTTEGYPYMHSTPLYPSAVVSALDSTAFDVRRATAQALFSITPDSQLAQDAQFYGFSPLGAYTQVRTLMAQLGLLNNQTQCRPITALQDLVVCPMGFYKVLDFSNRCADIRVQCPDGYQCICSPALPL